MLVAAINNNNIDNRPGHKILSSSRSSSYFYIQDKNQVLCSLKKNKLKQESLVSRKCKQEFYVSIKLKQAKRESSESSIEQEIIIYRGSNEL